MKRIYSIDITRGIVMVIMALDHVRDLIHVDAITQSPTNLETTTPILFFTRWITYLCAPTFVFLAGTSAYLSFKRTNDVSQTRSFLFKRGVYLVLLEFVIVNSLLYFDPGFHNFIFEVIAAIGFGFIVLALLLRSSVKSIGIAGLVIVCLHNLFPLIPFEEGSIFKTILSPLFGPAAFPLSADRLLIVAYPPVPWLGIMLTGFASGKLFEQTEVKRKSTFIKIGAAALLLFFVLRLINIYGDSAQWSTQKNTVYTFLSFINVTKYPPSLLFCLVTLGIMFLMLAFTTNAKGSLVNIVSVYGKVPLFYFLLHFLVIHVIMIVVMLLQGFQWHQLDFASGSFGRPKGKESGLSLTAVYLIWIGVVFVLYKPCLWLGKYKAEHKQWWLKYL
ncbi:MAG TPA: heparan-alpha-glucosaminide N-acetyltransferase domain-containing protein [Flavitalea sp.]|nr:heparan-alpha-glucosaminide N-acetyltransferase domain-containing protein [Flavitalea sp.]